MSVNVAGGVQRLIVLKPKHVVSHTHYGKPFGHLGNLMSVQVKVTSSTDKNCKVGTTGTMTVNATYNGVKVASVKLPVSAPEYVVFQNQDGPITQCPFCQGPLKYPVTAWLSSIKIWNKK